MLRTICALGLWSKRTIKKKNKSWNFETFENKNRSTNPAGDSEDLVVPTITLLLFCYTLTYDWYIGRYLVYWSGKPMITLLTEHFPQGRILLGTVLWWQKYVVLICTARRRGKRNKLKGIDYILHYGRKPPWNKGIYIHRPSSHDLCNNKSQ